MVEGRINHTLPAVRLVPLTTRLREELRLMRVHPHQEGFCFSLEVLLRRWEKLPPTERLRTPLAILPPQTVEDQAETAVGFIVLSPFHEAVAHFCKDESEVGLENLLIDQQHQGNGYGPAAIMALVSLIEERFPQARRAKFTVNVKNHYAIELYKRLGFVDTGKLYHGGKSGPQHVFCIPLRNGD